VAKRPLVIAVAAYSSKAAAERDFGRLCATDTGRDLLAAALVEKGADGRLTVDRYQGTAERLAGRLALLGGALVVLAAPVGILFLIPVVATTTAWAGVGAIVSHIWNDIPMGELRHMSDLVEATQAALVVIALDHTAKDLEPLLANAATAVVTDLTPADLDDDVARAIEEAGLK
jgi:hypothetical protein